MQSLAKPSASEQPWAVSQHRPGKPGFHGKNKIYLFIAQAIINNPADLSTAKGLFFISQENRCLKTQFADSFAAF